MKRAIEQFAFDFRRVTHGRRVIDWPLPFTILIFVTDIAYISVIVTFIFGWKSVMITISSWIGIESTVLLILEIVCNAICNHVRKREAKKNK